MDAESLWLTVSNELLTLWSLEKFVLLLDTEMLVKEVLRVWKLLVDESLLQKSTRLMLSKLRWKDMK